MHTAALVEVLDPRIDAQGPRDGPWRGQILAIYVWKAIGGRFPENGAVGAILAGEREMSETNK